MPIIPRIRGAVFYDTGFVNADAYDFGTDAYRFRRRASVCDSTCRSAR